MLHPALREAGHKWHSSQSCFHVSFLTPKGICRPTTLVALFFPHRLVSITPSREQLTLWEWKQVVFVMHIGVKMGTCRIFCYRLMPIYDTVSVSSHLLFFWSHCNACHPEVKPHFLFVGFSSWLAGTIKDFQWLKCLLWLAVLSH